jgi:hypothetical protein
MAAVSCLSPLVGGGVGSMHAMLLLPRHGTFRLGVCNHAPAAWTHAPVWVAQWAGQQSSRWQPTGTNMWCWFGRGTAHECCWWHPTAASSRQHAGCPLFHPTGQVGTIFGGCGLHLPAAVQVACGAGCSASSNAPHPRPPAQNPMLAAAAAAAVACTTAEV